MFRGDERQKEMLHRRDWLSNLMGPRKAWVARRDSTTSARSDGLVILPMPTTPVLRLPCWHTAAFTYPHALYRGVLARCLRQSVFHYVAHPADLMETRDLEAAGWPASRRVFARIDVDIQRKQRLFEEAISTIATASRKLCRLDDLCHEITSAPSLS
jgi:hypothetical protein